MNIVISGFYGLGNTGDEAILEAVISEIRRKDPAAAITVFSLSPEETAKRHNVHAVYRGWRHANKQKFQALKKADVLVSGGGGLLQDRYPTKIISGPLPYYLLVVLLARLTGTPVMFFSQGIGPVSSRYGRFLMRTLGNLPFLITVRDEESKVLAESLGIKKPIEVTADIVFAHPKEPSERCEASLPDGMGTRKRILVSVRPWFSDTHHYDALARTCDRLLDDGYELVFIPMEGKHDVKASRAVTKRMMNGDSPHVAILKEDFLPHEYLSFVKTGHALIGMRLHSLIFAVLQGIPHTAISYDPKVMQLMRRTGLDGYALLFESLTADELTDTVHRMLLDHASIQDVLRTEEPALRLEAEQNVEQLYESLSSVKKKNSN
ncbi:polysaccharide pyruvyl transferase CsaB [Salisediminibacterium selenitireducens]|uniref:Polysaccharide pyruvyl transferase CsaB n=1 Tax=Bacillus selenitireducens (strain ATCC 700615 / DSM 15326 / MLS10) TaxID=439292 RepID=D6Y046_BACIE|nr:polysaccharide pyruvyl transferase CsaB [Salisediminibacterium selenitireducens]ADI00548.1 polysaccharide pyruvyl transferase CsaB [[Bacillus] selenitireducens MLS10]